jgi:ribosomal protein L11 methylase PrmA
VLPPLAIPPNYRLAFEVGVVVVLIITIIVGYFLSTFLTGAGYEPVPNRILSEMIEFSQPTSGTHVFDLGSGFGRIIIAVAERTGADCTGVEVDPIKVWWTKRRIRAKGLQGRVRVLRQNLLEADLSSADIIFVFLWEGIMQKLEEKATREMKEGSRIVSYYHPIRDWVPDREDAKNKVYLYTVRTARA